MGAQVRVKHHRRTARKPRKGKKTTKKTLAIAAATVAIASFIVLYFLPAKLVDLPYVGTVMRYLDEMLHNPKLPNGNIYGIDVSAHQGNIDWQKVVINYDVVTRRLRREATGAAEKISFAIAKATEGKDFTDKMLQQNRDGIRRAGIIFGAYHFFSMQSTPEEQAAHYIAQCGLKRGDFVPVLDIEVDGGLPADEVRRRALAWLRIVEAHFGHRPMIYTSANFRTEIFSTHDFEKYNFWIGHYLVDLPKCPCDIWQFTDRGVVPGINGHVDVDILFGPSDGLGRFLMR